MGFKLCKALWKPIITAIVNQESRYRRTFPVGVPQPQPSQVPCRCLGTAGRWLEVMRMLLSRILRTSLLWFFLSPNPVLSLLLWKFNKTVANTCTVPWQDCGFLTQAYLTGLLLLFCVFPKAQQTPFIFHEIIQRADSWVHAWMEVWDS